MIIRSEQLRTLEAYAESAFETEMMAQLKFYAPKRCQMVDSEGLRRIVASGVQRARSYGLTRRGPVWRFLQLTCTLGYGFDTDPQLAWAAETLNDPAIETDMVRSECLYEGFVKYLNRVFGPDQQFAAQAMRRSLEVNFADAHGDWSTKSSLELMERIHPEKFDFIGEPVARTLIDQAGGEAAEYGLSGTNAGAAIAWMKFLWGHRICEDPYYPEVCDLLKSLAGASGGDKVLRLTSKARSYLVFELRENAQP